MNVCSSFVVKIHLKLRSRFMMRFLMETARRIGSLQLVHSRRPPKIFMLVTVLLIQFQCGLTMDCIITILVSCYG